MLSGFFVPVRLILILWSCNIQLQIHTKWIHHYTCHFITHCFRNFYRFQHSHRISCIRMVVLELQKLLNIGKYRQ